MPLTLWLTDSACSPMQNADTNIAMLGIAMPAPGDVG